MLVCSRTVYSAQLGYHVVCVYTTVIFVVQFVCVPNDEEIWLDIG